MIEFLQQSPEVGEMLSDIREYLQKWLPSFDSSNRSYFTVALGCTGGRHRSVYFSEHLYQHFVDQFPDSQVRHRDLER